jgi:hypothetical protein
MATVAVAGSLAQRPRHGGHAWVFLNYLLGLRRLGHRPLFFDRDETGGEGRRWLAKVMDAADMGEDWVLIDGSEGERRRALDLLSGADLLLDVNGYLGDEELVAAVATSAFLDIDPTIQQLWQELGLADVFGGYDLYFTVGELIGSAGCQVPDCGIEWIPTRQPVLLEAWPAQEGGAAFTSLATWRGPYGPIEFEGHTYGQRVHEFRRFFELPRLISAPFRLALDIEPADGSDIEALGAHGWELVEPAEVAATPEAYREFIAGSLAELSIPKEVYVASRCGWFSDRSACYLAAGKPVITVDTGFAGYLPVGAGLFCVDGPGSAAAACEAVLADPGRQGRAAHEIACEHFDSDRVLGRVLDAAGI